VEVQVDLIARVGGYANMISQGAEARVFSVQFLQRQTVVKQRFAKTYRHPALDAKLTRSRLNMEARSIVRARKLGVVTPTLYYVDTQQSAIYMEYVAGRPLKDLIRAGMSDDDMRAVGAQVGKAVAALHDGGLIHGDLTTSNIMVRDVDMRVVVIDFGLAHNSIIPEDKGVDLYVLVRSAARERAAERTQESFSFFNVCEMNLSMCGVHLIASSATCLTHTPTRRSAPSPSRMQLPSCSSTSWRRTRRAPSSGAPRLTNSPRSECAGANGQ